MDHRVLTQRFAGTSYAHLLRPRALVAPSRKFIYRRCSGPSESASGNKVASTSETATRAEKEDSKGTSHASIVKAESEPTSQPSDLPWLPGSSSSSDEEMDDDNQNNTTALASLAVPVLGIGLLLGGGYFFKDSIRDFLQFFITAVEDWGPAGYAAYAFMYIALEVLCVPAIPLTMTAGAIFGPEAGTAMVSACATIAATIAFLIARYAAREKVLAIASNNKRWASIDRAIGKDGLKFVTLLRLSPLLPLAASNYLYGLTSVDLGPYVLGSFLGMLPGTYAFVSAGDFGAAVLMNGEGSLEVSPLQIGVGLAVTVVALGFIGQLAKKAIEDADREEEEGGSGL
eukprot:gene20916-27764_t